MAHSDTAFKNILVIHFGQLGDVILGLPAFSAIKRRFPDAKVTIMSGKATAEIVRVSGFANEQIVVDRVAIRDGKKLWSLLKVFQLARDVRRPRFDLVIDLHSLYETNILGFLSGAKSRLFANRENRSLDWLGRFPERPPLEDKTMHYTHRYFDVLKPLGIDGYKNDFTLNPPVSELAAIDTLYEEIGVAGKVLVGLFIGAGHASRCWSIDNFADLAFRLSADPERKILVFMGPEEAHLLDQVRRTFPASAVILDKLKLIPLMAATSKLDVLIANDTGPMHLAAVAGTRIVLILDSRSTSCFLPLTRELIILNRGPIDEISVEEVEQAAIDVLSASIRD